MAKLSLSNVLYNRRRMNLLTLLCCLILIFFLGSILVAQNPNKTRAASGVVKTGVRYSVYGGCTSYKLYNYGGVQAIETAGGACGGTVITPLPDNANLELDGWFGTFEVTTYSDPGKPVKLNRISIMGNFNIVTLTHDALTVAEATNCDAAPKNSSILDSGDLLIVTPECRMARAKKVDIEATDKITMLAGGIIDVDGKGYPGGYWNVSGVWQNDSYGPGRGGDSVAGIDRVSGFGGSFGGLGNHYPGFNPPNAGTIYNYYNAGSGETEFGSGGGAVYYNGGEDYAGTWGGEGGGRVRLKANTLAIEPLSYITADGGTGHQDGNYIDNTGGGGSGGAIVLNVANIDMSAVINDSFASSSYPTSTVTIPEKFNAIVSGGKNNGLHLDTYGSDGVIQVNTQDNVIGSLFQMSAQGGRACAYFDAKFCTRAAPGNDNDGSGGGGGWIVVQSAGDVSGVSINKLLIPVSRTDGTTVFNPYALKMGDIIRVQLDVYNMVPGNTYSITDEALMTSGIASGQKCGIVLNSSVPSGITASDEIINWTVVSGPTGQQTLSYRCQVQQMIINLEG